MLGVELVFDGGSKLLYQMFGLEVSAKQIQRVSEWYGSQIDPIINANHTEYMPKNPTKENETTYVMVDGSMVFTREEKWKEMKLARIFNASHNVAVHEKRKEIVQSVFVSYLGSIEKFCPKLERHLALYKSNKVFIADGAKWIWNWVEDNYPGSTQILDYYHAIEKIETFAKVNFSEQERKEWIKVQENRLKNDEVNEVILDLKKIKVKNKMSKELKQTVLNYFIEHEDRMLYKTFAEKGLMIGSGPIESAHRKVIQHRMKLSGQRWSIKGGQAIANLRCYQQSNSWDKVDNLIRLAA